MADNKLAPCNIIDTYDTYSTIELSNRFFTAKKDAIKEKHIPFTYDIDPLGLLTSAAGNKYIHAAQNEVKYYNLVEDRDGKPRCVISGAGKQS